MSFKESAKELIKWAWLVADDEIEVLPVWVLDSARLNPKRPANLTIAVPDEYVKNLNGLDPHDVYVMVRVKHDAHEEWAQIQAQPDAIKKATGIFIGDGGNKEPVA